MAKVFLFFLSCLFFSSCTSTPAPCAEGFVRNEETGNCENLPVMRSTTGDDTAVVPDSGDTASEDSDTGVPTETGDSDTGVDTGDPPSDYDGDGYPDDVDCNRYDPGQYPGGEGETIAVADSDCDNNAFPLEGDGHATLHTLQSGDVRVAAMPNGIANNTYTPANEEGMWWVKDYEGESEPVISIEEMESPFGGMPGTFSAVRITSSANSGGWCVGTNGSSEANRGAIFSRVLFNAGDGEVLLTEELVFGRDNVSGGSYSFAMSPGDVVSDPSGIFRPSESVVGVGICASGEVDLYLFEAGLFPLE